jgi:putative transposase
MTLPWHHSPPHLFTPELLYMVTAGTLHKNHIFSGQARLDYLQATLLRTIDKYGWIIQAWAVFVNHYHFIAQASKIKGSLTALIKELHSITAIEVNRLDHI